MKKDAHNKRTQPERGKEEDNLIRANEKPLNIRDLKSSTLNTVLIYIRRRIILYYYRYSVEVGVSMLDRWEAFIINSAFLLLIVSIVKQAVKAFCVLFTYLKQALS